MIHKRCRTWKWISSLPYDVARPLDYAVSRSVDQPGARRRVLCGRQAGFRQRRHGCFYALWIRPLAYRLHQRLWPLHQGLSRLDRPVYSPWWGAHQIQLFYDAFPALEALLRLIPGAYSAWLRAWGSRIGRRVHWTPRVDITDRGLLEVGDDVIFGHLVGCYAHVVDRRGGRLMLYSKPIRIGAGAFIGAGSRLGPGARIEPGSYLPALTDVGIREIRRAGQSG